MARRAAGACAVLPDHVLGGRPAHMPPRLTLILHPKPCLAHGSYMWRGGRLARVPAARADIFRDRGLGPADKRALMRFLTAAADALRGAGPLYVRHTPWPALTQAHNNALAGCGAADTSLCPEGPFSSGILGFCHIMYGKIKLFIPDPDFTCAL